MPVQFSIMKQLYHRDSSSQIAYYIFLLLGVGVLLPWNLFITADAYYTSRFVDTPYAKTFLNWFSISFNLTTLATTTIITSWCKQHLPSIKVQILCPLIGNSILLALTSVFVELPTFRGVPLFWATLLCTILSSIHCSIAQTGLFALSSYFPAEFTQAFMTGQGIAGLLVSMSNFGIDLFSKEQRSSRPAQVVSGLLLTSVQQLNTCAFIYFFVGTLICALCIVSYLHLNRLKITQYYLLQMELQQPEAIEEEKKEDRIIIEEHRYTQPLLLEEPLGPHVGRTIWQRIQYHGLAVFMTFFVTLVVFPGQITSLRCSESARTASRLCRDLFTPLCFVLFNIGDVSGRVLAGRFCPPAGAGTSLSIASCARLIYILYFDLVSRHSWLKYAPLEGLMILTCAMSNGYLSSVAMMTASKCVKIHEQEQVGRVMFFLLTLGLSCGSMLAFLLSH